MAVRRAMEIMSEEMLGGLLQAAEELLSYDKEYRAMLMAFNMVTMVEHEPEMAAEILKVFLRSNIDILYDMREHYGGKPQDGPNIREFLRGMLSGEEEYKKELEKADALIRGLWESEGSDREEKVALIAETLIRLFTAVPKDRLTVFLKDWLLAKSDQLEYALRLLKEKFEKQLEKA